MAPVDKSEDSGAGAMGSVERVGDTAGSTVAKLSGEIDISNADAIGAVLEGIVDQAGDHLVIDAAQLEFMDSSGIAVLLRAAGRVGSVEIRNPSTVIRRIIECTGLADVLRINS